MCTCYVYMYTRRAKGGVLQNGSETKNERVDSPLFFFESLFRQLSLFHLFFVISFCSSSGGIPDTSARAVPRAARCLHLTAKGGLYARRSGFKRHLNAVHKKHTAVLKVGGDINANPLRFFKRFTHLLLLFNALFIRNILHNVAGLAMQQGAYCGYVFPRNGLGAPYLLHGSFAKKLVFSQPVS